MPPPPHSLRRSQRPHYRLLAATIDDFDYHFLHTAALTLGISRAELVRRIFFQARSEFMRGGIYRVPEDLKSLRQLADEIAKSHLPYYIRKRRGLVPTKPA
jgi:hypothetical protein